VDLSHTRVTVIVAVTFAKCSALTTVLLPIGLTEIDNQAFFG
jgi:hypothetical protein